MMISHCQVMTMYLFSWFSFGFESYALDLRVILNHKRTRKNCLNQRTHLKICPIPFY